MTGGSHIHPDKYLGMAGADRPRFFLGVTSWAAEQRDARRRRGRRGSVREEAGGGAVFSFGAKTLSNQYAM